MEPTAPFRHALQGGGVPQILILGNGLERACGGDGWNQLLNRVDVRYTDGQGNVLKEYGAERKRLEDALPFPLLYELLATLPHPPAQLTPEELDAEEQRLAAMMKELLSAPIDLDGKYQLFKELPGLGADHIFTTNYTYIPEKALLPRGSFAYPRNRSRFRFQLGTEKIKRATSNKKGATASTPATASERTTVPWVSGIFTGNAPSRAAWCWATTATAGC